MNERIMVDSPADNYWPEPCANCAGKGKLRLDFAQLPEPVRQYVIAHPIEPQCPVCAGRAFVLVLQPAQPCRQCAGRGRAGHYRCFACLGTGWMFALKEGVGFLR
jgi:DnaJ-class molecular chaperone